MKRSLLFCLLWLCIGTTGFAQMTVTGTLTDATDGEPLIGATVLVKDSSTGTVTEFDGSYSLEVPDGNAVLVFSYTGMQTVEEPVGGRTTIDKALSSDAELLEEVVVIGYGSQKRSQITGAVGVVNAEELTDGANVRVDQALQGKAAGVLVTQNSGSPGAAALLRIRGISTINDASPLFIVDGVRVEGIDYLNPNDIETVSVLKDAASAAIYGASAGNGVILITTKGGKFNQVGKVSYEGNFGIQTVGRKLNLLNASEYALIQNEAYVAAGNRPLPEFSNPAALGEGTDWQDAIFGDAPMASQQLAFSGGSETSSYLVSGNYTLQEGIIGADIGENKSRFERYTARFNSNHKLKDWLNIGNRLSYTNFNRNALAENNQFNSPVIRALNIDPVTPVFKNDGTYAYSRYADTDIANPVNAIEQTYNTWTNNRVVGNIFAEIEPIKGLKIRSDYAGDVSFAQEDIFLPRFDLSRDTMLSDAPAAEKNLINTVVANRYIWTGWQWENTINYTFNVAARNTFNILLGTTARANRGNVTGASGTNLPNNDPDFAFINNTIDLENRRSFGYVFEGAGSSIFGRILYDFDDRYNITASVRRDGSSRFGPGNRFGIFPAASFGWNITNEDFFNVEQISRAKLRASWGVNGNDRIPDFQFLTVIQPGQNYVFGPTESITNGSTPITASNPDIKWEESTQTNIGLDVELFDGKVELIADYFNKKTIDMLYAVPIPFHVGAEPGIQNIADMVNTGWEFTANHRNRIGKIEYNVGGNVTFTDTEITSLGNGAEPIFTGRIQSANANAIKTDVGLPLAAFWGYQTDGLFQNQAEVDAHAFQNKDTAPGDIRFKDLNNDGVIDSEDQGLLGSALPDVTFGFNAGMKFMGFDIAVGFYGTAGNEIYNNTTRYDFIYVNRPNTVLNRWTGEGTSNSEPRVNIEDPNQNARISDRFIEDGSFLRMRSLELGYNLPAVILQKIRMSKIRAYVQGTNLVTWTNYSGYDPVIGQVNPGQGLEIGIDYGFYPTARGFLVGLQAEF